MRARIEAQPWRNAPPFATVTLYRATCACGFVGEWYRYRENASRERDEHLHEPPRILPEGDRPSEQAWKP